MARLFLNRYVGSRVRRIEDLRILRGEATYVDDIRLTGMLHAVFVRSQYPHARIKSVDASDALKAPGVVGVYTWRDLEKGLKPFELGRSDPFYPLARDKVRFVGEPVAVVVAEDPYKAMDAAELVVVDYEPLDAVASVDEALREGAPRIHEAAPDNIGFDKTYGCGDVDKVFREAPIVLGDTLYNSRVYAASMEPRGVVAHYDGETLTVWSSTQTPFDLRDEILDKFRAPPKSVRVIQPDVGGAFGAKIPTYPEDLVIPYLAYTLRRPVKWYAYRREDMVSTTHGRDIRARLEVAVDRGGRILGIRGEVVADLGAYPLGAALPAIATRILSGAYDIRAGRVRALGVYTNKTPLGAYRGAGRPEGIFFIERMVDLVADELGMDPVEVRLVNMVGREQMPYKNCFGFEYDSGDYPTTLKRALEALGVRELERWAEEERRKGRLVGLGYAFYVEITSGGPFESAYVRLEPNGRVEIVVGSTPTGQGDATAFAQLAADIFGVELEKVRVRWGDTGLIGEGVGTFGSRTLAVGGGAVIEASRQIIEKARRAAAEVLGVDESEVDYEPGYYYVKGDPARRVSLLEVAERVYRGESSVEPPLEAKVLYDPKHPVYPFGLHAAVVEVDPESGRVRVLKYLSYDDVGKAVNPMLVEGQLHGGVMQGIGQVLYEHMAYDDSGYPLTQSLGDYGVPTAHEAPMEFRVVLQETQTHHPHGVRGVGEIGSIAAPPALVRAIENAFRPRRVRITKTPVKPEDVYKLVKGVTDRV